MLAQQGKRSERTYFAKGCGPFAQGPAARAYLQDKGPYLLAKQDKPLLSKALLRFGRSLLCFAKAFQGSSAYFASQRVFTRFGQAKLALRANVKPSRAAAKSFAQRDAICPTHCEMCKVLRTAYSA